MAPHEQNIPDSLEILPLPAPGQSDTKLPVDLNIFSCQIFYCQTLLNLNRKKRSKFLGFTMYHLLQSICLFLIDFIGEDDVIDSILFVHKM